jgi:hypothetical protein
LFYQGKAGWSVGRISAARQMAVRGGRGRGGGSVLHACLLHISTAFGHPEDLSVPSYLVPTNV